MNEDGQFWLGVWIIVGLNFVVGIYPITSCTKDYNDVRYKSIQEALSKGCNVTDGSTVVINCK